MLRLVTRNPIATADPVTVAEVARHLRLETVEAMDAMGYVATAALEVEDAARLALLTTEVVARGEPAQVLTLPIGPVLEEADVQTVELINPDGSTVVQTSGWGLLAGQRAAIAFDETPDRPVRVIYRAGYGDTEADVPADLRHAVLDQALRLYDLRGDVDAPAPLCPAAARICARYSRVSLGAA